MEYITYKEFEKEVKEMGFEVSWTKISGDILVTNEKERTLIYIEVDAFGVLNVIGEEYERLDDETKLKLFNLSARLSFTPPEKRVPVKLTTYEMETLKLVKENWTARDKDGLLYFYDKEPKRSSANSEVWGSCFGKIAGYHGIFDNLFQFVKWEDEQPYNIQELIETAEVAMPM